MAKFLNRFGVTEELQKIIEDARDYLILISPYFKLNEFTKKALSRHQYKKDFDLVIVYGKNENDKSRSLSDHDLDFLKSFQNIEIRYHKRLHAKMYINEEKCLLTSMNFHDYSMNENIEFGVLTKSKSLELITDIANFLKPNLIPESLDKEAFDFVQYIVEKSHTEFSKHVKKQKSFFGLIKKYGESKIEVDNKRYGYCIRTAVKIPLNLQQPYSLEAYSSWVQYKNPDYTEKYCHICGGNYRTSMAKPMCSKCFAET